MPDPLTAEEILTWLLDAIWIEARWQLRLQSIRIQAAVWRWWQWPAEQDSLSGRNVFWVTLMEEK